MATPSDLVFIEKYEAGADVGSFSFASTLDGDTDEFYIIEGVWVPSAAVSSDNLRLFINGGATGSQAVGGSQAHSVAAAPIGCSSAALDTVLKDTDTHYEVFLHLEMHMVLGSSLRREFYCRNVSRTLARTWEFQFITGVTGLAGNITQLGFYCTATPTSIKAGSWFNLYKQSY